MLFARGYSQCVFSLPTSTMVFRRALYLQRDCLGDIIDFSSVELTTPVAVACSLCYFASALTQSVNSRRCLRISTNPGRLWRNANGLPRKSLSTSPEPSRNPVSPSRSIFPAQIFHCIGRSVCDPETSPKHTTNVATMASMDMSIGRELLVCWCDKVCFARAADKAACSCAE